MFNERNAEIKEKDNEKIVKKNETTVVRHEKNLEKLCEENEKIEQENKNKAFQKYVSFVYIYIIIFSSEIRKRSKKIERNDRRNLSKK